MEVNYYKLKEGLYILEEGDTLTLHGIKYQVDRCSGYFLRNTDKGSNNAVLRLFGMIYPETDEWAKQFGEVIKGGLFPEFRELKDLTKCVIALYEKPLYKKGDKVRIAERKEDAKDYPFTFTDEMVKHKGEVFEVACSQPMCKSSYIEREETANGDVHLYRLNDTYYNWHSSMFERVTCEETETFKESTQAPIMGFLEKAIDAIAHLRDNNQNKSTDNQIIIKPKQKIKTIIKL